MRTACLALQRTGLEDLFELPTDGPPVSTPDLRTHQGAGHSTSHGNRVPIYFAISSAQVIDTLDAHLYLASFCRPRTAAIDLC
jgi:hypothetical protein